MEAHDGQPPRPRRRRMARRLALSAVAVGLAAAFVVDRRVVDGFAGGRCLNRVRVYGAARTIPLGLHLERAGIYDDLASLGYRPVTQVPEVSGTFRRTPGGLDIFLRQVPRADAFADRPAELVAIELDGGRVSGIARLATGERPAAIELDPPLLEGVLDEHWTGREPLRLDEVPPHVVDAVLAAEDARFLAHPGIDLGSLFRAVRVNWEAQEVRQGGSTITQQVVKNHFLSQERTFGRKLREIPLALALEWRFSKREILECYLATVYLGNDRLVGVYGLAEAARVYFGKPVGQLTAGEAATLAGMIRAPNALSPLRHPARASERRDEVLGQLEHLGWIGAAEARAARAESLPRPERRAAAPEAYFLGEVRRELEAEGLEPRRLVAGSAVFTTLDVRLQRIAQAAVAAAGRELDGAAPGRRGVQIAVVALDPLSGALRALVGGRDYLGSQLDRATQVRRPVGSLFKPFVYLAALDDPAAGLTAATLLPDEPVVLEVGRREWAPQNYDERFRGPVTVRTALEQSLNVPAVRLAEQLGVERVAGLAESLALGRAGVPRVPAIALGAFPASLLEVVASYSVFPGGGEQVEPRAIEAVEAPSGVALFRPRRRTTRIARAAPAYVVHAMLTGAVERGTARAIRAAGLRRPLAGKTGTTDDYRDAWFVGYTPSLLLGVWVGFDDDRALPGSAARVALPVWTSIARQALAGAPAERFAVPSDVELVEVDAATGRRAAPGCGRSLTEAFVRGTAPEESCLPGEEAGPRQASPADRAVLRRAGEALAQLLSAIRAFW